MVWPKKKSIIFSHFIPEVYPVTIHINAHSVLDDCVHLCLQESGCIPHEFMSNEDYHLPSHRMQPDVSEGHVGGSHGLVCLNPLSVVRRRNTATTSSTIRPEGMT